MQLQLLPALSWRRGALLSLCSIPAGFPGRCYRNFKGILYNKQRLPRHEPPHSLSLTLQNGMALPGYHLDFSFLRDVGKQRGQQDAQGSAGSFTCSVLPWAGPEHSWHSHCVVRSAEQQCKRRTRSFPAHTCLQPPSTLPAVRVTSLPTRSCSSPEHPSHPSHPSGKRHKLGSFQLNHKHPAFARGYRRLPARLWDQLITAREPLGHTESSPGVSATKGECSTGNQLS